MIGHTTSGSSIEGSDALWLSIKKILEDKNITGTMEQDLFNALYDPNYNINSDFAGQVAATEAAEVASLYKFGLLDNINITTYTGYCSFLNVDKDTGQMWDVSGDNTKTSTVAATTVSSGWDANCGMSFGHEWMFSRYLDKYKNITYNEDMFNDTEAVKVASGGSEIHKHWYPGYGMHWNTLEKTIANKVGEWKGFVWHQGTQEVWTAEDTSITYEGNLTGLVKQVRTDMFTATPGTWECKEEIPVVIVQIGYWPNVTESQNVRKAQQTYCDETPRATMVVMNDLSQFYHFDAASFVIGGYRIAKALEDALDEPVTCPTQTCAGEVCKRDWDCCDGHVCTKGNSKICELLVPEPTPPPSIQMPTPPTGGCTVGQHGESCSENIQCCTNKCKNSECKGSLFN